MIEENTISGVWTHFNKSSRRRCKVLSEFPDREGYVPIYDENKYYSIAQLEELEVLKDPENQKASGLGELSVALVRFKRTFLRLTPYEKPEARKICRKENIILTNLNAESNLKPVISVSQALHLVESTSMKASEMQHNFLIMED